MAGGGEWRGGISECCEKREDGKGRERTELIRVRKGTGRERIVGLREGRVERSRGRRANIFGRIAREV